MASVRIAIVTTGRADYGVLYPLIQALMRIDFFDVQLIATGAHLSPLHGKTLTLIQQDDVQVADTVEMIMKGDSEADICTSIAMGLKGFSSILDTRQPDLVVVLGDRYELWAVCIAAVIHIVPIAHLYGGESTFGLIDEAVRHSVTKMATFHFASIEAYAKRIVQMGENLSRVFVVGALAIDNIKAMRLMDAREFAEYTGIDPEMNAVALFTYHPVTLDDRKLASVQVREILEALIRTDLVTLATMPNADTGASTILQTIQEYLARYPKRFRFVANLGQRGYVSAMRHARIMIGNSSSGIVESPSFKLPVVNVGDRQAGRIKAANVLDCPCSQEPILRTIEKALSPEFTMSISNLDSPYGDGTAAQRIASILKDIDYSDKSRLIKKGFCDIDLPSLPDLTRVGDVCHANSVHRNR